MPEERLRRLRAEMAGRGLDALALRTTPNATYAGAGGPCIVTPEVVIPLTRAAVADRLRRGENVGADDLMPELFDLDVVDGEDAVAAARCCKTRGEIERIRRAQQINEAALAGVDARPGLHQDELTEQFLARAYELGATENIVEPLWQVCDRDAPLVFPVVGQDHTFAPDDLVFVDTGIAYEGYVSDYGRTWGGRRDHFERWRDVLDAALAAVKPGATGLDLVRAAGTFDGHKPWLDHLYLAHGTGTASAEAPLIGTDRGEAFDDSIVLAPGMVLVFEPVIWRRGEGGYRAEETIAVTESGYELLSERVEW